MTTATPTQTGLPPDIAARVDELLRDHPPATTDPRNFFAARFDAGLAWLWAATGQGGCDADQSLQGALDARLIAAGAPQPFSHNPIGIGMVAPTLLTHGTAQQRSHLRALFSGVEVWCQLFSEPSVGSDVAGLSTRARRDGDEWVVDGQKVWTSFAHVARRALLLARTDPDVPKHAGLTAFVVDMTAPGVEVRPLRQATGEAEFNEVYLTGVRLSDADRVGELGDGWRVATTTLMNERVALGGLLASKTAEPGTEIVDAYRIHQGGGKAIPGQAVRRDQAVQLWIEANVLSFTAARAMANGDAGRPGPEGSVLKLAGAEHTQRVHEYLLDIVGASGMRSSPRADTEQPQLPFTSRTASETAVAYVRSRANTIEGGTSEVMRNIIGERVLGLPAEPRLDKTVPWRDIPRS